MSENPNALPKEEKPTDYDKKVKRYVLVLLTIVVMGLVISMFKTSRAPKEPPKIEGHSEDMMQPVDFNKQVKLEENQINAARFNGSSITHEEPSSNREEEDPDWEKKEKTRVLNARQSAFGLNTPNNQQSNTTDGAAHFQAATPIAPSMMSVTHPVSESSSMDRLDGSQLVPTGTIIDGVLDRDITSDYTGPWEGHTIQDIYSIDNQFILLPKGTKIMGQSLHIGNVNEPIQNRMGMTVEWAVLPNGKRIDFHKNTPIDVTGIPAFEGDVNHHFFAQFMSVTAYALISSEAPRDVPNQYGSTQPTFQGQFADSYRGAMLPFVMKYLNLVPTVTLHAGMPIKIHTQDDMYLKPWNRVNTTVYSTDSL